MQCAFLLGKYRISNCAHVYDAFLPQLTTPSQYNAVSSLGML